MEPNNQSPKQPEAVASTPVAEGTLPNIPDTWPGAFGLYKYSKQAVKNNIQTVVVLVVLNLLVNIILRVLLGKTGSIVELFVSALFSIATISTYFAGLRDRNYR